MVLDKQSEAQSISNVSMSVGKMNADPSNFSTFNKQKCQQCQHKSINTVKNLAVNGKSGRGTSWTKKVLAHRPSSVTKLPVPIRKTTMMVECESSLLQPTFTLLLGDNL